MTIQPQLPPSPGQGWWVDPQGTWHHSQIPPSAPYVNQFPAPPVLVVPNRFPWYMHMIHAGLTFMTCFLWAPIWALHVGLHKKHKRIVRY